jgi:putative tryptophan/tyrosine transport system substrate-binding protein
MRPRDRTMWHSAFGSIVTLTLSFLTASLEADAQPSAKIATIGYLSIAGGAPGGAPLAESFRQGLQDLGYVEGKTIAIAYRSAEGKPERLPALAAELVQLPVDVIFAQSGQVAEAAKVTTTTIPIVMVSGADPVAIGLVASLARPGGNITGLSLMSAELAGKRLQLLKEASGSLGRVAVLWNARDAVMTNIFSEIQTAAPLLGMTVQPLGVQEAKDIEGAIAAMTEERPDALFMITDVLTSRYVRQVLDFAVQHQLPTMFQSIGGVTEGGLMSYAPSFTDAYRRAAYYVDRILKGAKPGDLPVEQPTKFELVVNLKTAKALGITIPPTLLMLADKVIE